MFDENKNKYFRGSGFTSGQGPAEVAIRSVEFEQRNVQQPTGRRLWVDSGKKDYVERCFDPCDAVAFSPAEKVFEATEKERNSESHVQSVTSKDWGQSAPMDTSSTFLTGERRQEKESLKRDLEEELKKKPDQVNDEAGLDSVKPKLGKEKDPFKRLCDDSVLPSDKDKLFVKDRSLGKLKFKEPEKEKRKEKYYNLEKMKENGREKGSHHMQKAPEKDKDQTKRDEKGLGIADAKKEAQRDRQREKGSNGEKKKGSDESEKGKGKKTVMAGIRSENVSCSYAAQNDKKHREKGGNVAGFEERRKRRSVDKDEERRKGVEKDTKKCSKEKRCSSEVKEKTKHHNRNSDVEGKVKCRDKDFKDNGKRKRHASDWDREHNTGKSSKEVEKVSSGEDEGFGTSNDAKTKSSGKDKPTDFRNSSSVSCNAAQNDRGNSTSLILPFISERINSLFCNNLPRFAGNVL